MASARAGASWSYSCLEAGAEGRDRRGPDGGVGGRTGGGDANDGGPHPDLPGGHAGDCAAWGAVSAGLQDPGRGVEHASRGPLPVRMIQFCPEVPTEVALRLVDELEEFNKGLQ